MCLYLDTAASIQGWVAKSEDDGQLIDRNEAPVLFPSLSFGRFLQILQTKEILQDSRFFPIYLSCQISQIDPWKVTT